MLKNIRRGQFQNAVRVFLYPGILFLTSADGTPVAHHIRHVLKIISLPAGGPGRPSSRWPSVGLMTSVGCKGVEPPYPPGQPPAVERADGRHGSGVGVDPGAPRQGSSGGGPAANLMLVAQAPARFSGTIQVSATSWSRWP